MSDTQAIAFIVLVAFTVVVWAYLRITWWLNSRAPSNAAYGASASRSRSNYALDGAAAPSSFGLDCSSGGDGGGGCGGGDGGGGGGGE